MINDELGQARTSKNEFLDKIERIIPWDTFSSIIKPCYYKGERGNKPYPLELMLRIFLLQNLYDLADMRVMTEVIDSRAFFEFCGVTLPNEVPDGDTIGRFRNLLMEHELQKKIFDVIVNLLTERGLILKKGTIVDSTLIAAPSSTKNQEKKRDPEAHSTKKGNQWHFGYKGHIGVDEESGLVCMPLGLPQQGLAEYYGTAIVPARVRKPQDKGLVEKSVGFSTTWITAALREHRFFSFSEVKEAVAERLEFINTKPFQKRPGCRREAYLSEEKEFMLPLPKRPYEPAVWKQQTVGNDYLISDGLNKYSVPFDLIGEQVQIRLTRDLVEMTNNLAERTVKPYVINRKNFLFSDTEKGADASAAIMSIIEIAKRNNLDVYGYLLYLLTVLPEMGTDPTEDQIKSVMPWSFALPAYCKQTYSEIQ